MTNCCNFICNAKSFISFNRKIPLPVLVCASGPSLEPCLKTIAENQSKLFILALSSALSVLIKNNIIPDLVLSTDGGYWAGEHLKPLLKNKSIPLACPAEAYIPKSILTNNPVLPLEYDDSSSFISTQIIQKAGINCFKALRNPTVSGTALYLAESLTDNKVYFTGLDLHAQPGLQHSKPNRIENINSITETRLINKESRNSRSRFNSGSLAVYEEWFSSITDKNILDKTLRVIDPQYKQNTLGFIKEIDSKTFEKEINGCHELSTDKKEYFTSPYKNSSSNNNEIFDFILSQLDNQKWQKQIFPADFISIQNGTGINIEQQLASKIERLKDKIRKLKNG